MHLLHIKSFSCRVWEAFCACDTKSRTSVCPTASTPSKPVLKDQYWSDVSRFAWVDVECRAKKTVKTAHKELLTLEGAVDNMTLWDGMQGKGTVVLTATWLHPFQELNFNQDCQIWINWIFKKMHSFEKSFKDKLWSIQREICCKMRELRDKNISKNTILLLPGSKIYEMRCGWRLFHNTICHTKLQ